jgi:DNA ligase-1
MKSFAALYRRLDQSNATRDKLAALRAYFSSEPPADAAWALHFLSGGRARRIVSTRVLRQAAIAQSGLSEWLFEECYAAVGDLAETVALVLDAGESRVEGGLDDWIRHRLLPIAGLEPTEAAVAVAQCWALLDREQRFVFNKLITGGLRVGVARPLVVRALAEVCGIEPGLLAQRMVGFAEGGRLPDAASFLALCAPSRSTADPSPSAAGSDAAGSDAAEGALPYPFQLAQSWTSEDAERVDAADCFFEWKWDGLRAQLVRQGDRVTLWSRGEELISDRFPELSQAALKGLPPGVTLDGEIVCWTPGEPAPMPFAVLQTRIGRKRPGPKTLQAAPARFIAFDCLRSDHRDLRSEPLSRRKAELERLLKVGSAVDTSSGADADASDASCLEAPRGSPLPHQDGQADRWIDALPPMRFSSWEAAARCRAEARTFGAEGLMIKHLEARYLMGRARSTERKHWWKWKLDPFSVDAVLVYAQAGHGRRAGLYTDYTFAVWDDRGDEPKLIPFAKAYSGLTDQEIRQVDGLIRRSTLERFGPVRSVEPTLVFEIAFEGIQASRRHRAGVAVRFPRILRWRMDKRPQEADRLSRLIELVEGLTRGPSVRPNE